MENAVCSIFKIHLYVSVSVRACVRARACVCMCARNDNRMSTVLPNLTPANLYYEEIRRSRNILFLEKRIDFNSPCSPGELCADANTVCVQGTCQCAADFYFKDGHCGK